MRVKTQTNPQTDKWLNKETNETVSLPHQWPFPFSNGKKVITPKVEDKKKSLKKEYPEALF